VSDSSCREWLHSSDWRLGQPIDGIGRMGDPDLESVAISAPYRAVERIVESALEEQAAGLLLSGNLVDPVTCGAAALSFLEQVFESLEEGGIPVYWALGELDALERWPAMPKWPDNVHVFATDRWEAQRIERGGRALELVGWSRPSSGARAPTCGLGARSVDARVVVAAGYWSGAAAPHQVAYWAAGGATAGRTEVEERMTVRWPGTPQPRDMAACRDESSVTWLGWHDDHLQWCTETVASVAAVDRACPGEWYTAGAEHLQMRLQRDLEQLAQHIKQNCPHGIGVKDGHILVRWIVESSRPADRWTLDPAWELSTLEQLDPVRLDAERIVIHPAALQRPMEDDSVSTWPVDDDGLLGDLLREFSRTDGDAIERGADKTTELARCARTLGLDHRMIRALAASWTIARLAEDRRHTDPAGSSTTSS